MIRKTVFTPLYCLPFIISAFFSTTTDVLSAPDNKTFFINNAKIRQLPNFLLFDHDFKPLRNAQIEGKWTLFFFGYLNCPDICPTTLQTLALIFKQLDQKKSEVMPEVIFVSVDPWRDTPDKLKQYVQYFNSEFIGASADAPQLNILTNFFKIIYYNNRSPEQQQDYEVAHSDQLLLVNPSGQYEGFFKSPLDSELIAEELITIINQ